MTAGTPTARRAEIQATARAATARLLTEVLAQARLPLPAARAVVDRLAPAGQPVTVEDLAVLLDQLGRRLQLVAYWPATDATDTELAGVDHADVGERQAGAA